MRAVLLIILICLTFSGEASAMEALWGRVMSVDRQARQMVVRARPMAAGHVGDDKGGAVEPGRELTVRFANTELPQCVAEGTVVRLWGAYTNTNPVVFEARYIRGAGQRFWGYDPTGVRQRLGMGRGKGRGRRSPGMKGSKPRPPTTPEIQ